MTTLDRGEDKIHYNDLQQHYDQEDISGYCSLNSEKADSPITPNISRTTSASAVVVPSIGSAGGDTPPQLDEKRMRREIANSNERRRMQSINAGFQSLRSLLPHHEGEKLSKAAILQQTADYIYQLEQERTNLLSQNCRLKRIISKHEGELALSNSPPSPSTPSKKRKTTDPCDDAITTTSEYEELKTQLDQERTLRRHLEEKLLRRDTLYPITVTTTADELVQESLSTEHITLRYHSDDAEVKEEPVENVLIGPGSSPFESRTCSDDVSSPHSLDGKRTVILHPVVAHDESLISPTTATVLGGHQYAASTVLVNQPTCSPTTTIKTSRPKVEVERLPSPASVSLVTTITSTCATTTTTSSLPVPCPTLTTSPDLKLPPGRVYLTSASRPNLQTLVEAMRHLEGDSLFGSPVTPSCTTNSSTNQEVPLALTKRSPPQAALLQVDMDPFLTFHTRQNTQTSNPSSMNSNAGQQQRPGVIVVKQQT